MKKKILALVLAFTMCFGTTMTANAAMIVKNDMSALGTSNILDKNSSQIPKGTLQYLASKFKIEYTQEDLDALKKIFDANLYAKAYPDVAAAYGNDREALWNHYVTHGIKEGRTQINSTFNVFAYIAAYPDLRNAFGDDLMAYYVHYANYGMNENRKLITVDAVTKAGYTITGINGQVIAVPKLEPAPVEEPDPVEEQETVQEPVPTQEPTTPIETPCKHQWTEDTCDICGTIHKEHTWTKHIVSGKDESTCTRKCDVCNYSITEEHKTNNEYQYDEEYHWQNCVFCNSEMYKKGHEYESNNNGCLICKYEQSQTEKANEDIKNNTPDGENEDTATQ